MPLKEKRAAAEKQSASPSKEAIARLAADKGISEEEAERILKERARARKAAAQKAATAPTDATDDSEEQKYGIFQRKRSVISVKKQFARDTKICLQLILTVKLPRRKRKRKPKLRKQKKM